VDDGSGDRSLEKLLEIKRERQDVKVIKLARNFGSIQACKAGLPQVTGDCFLFMAADLQDPPDLIVKLADKWLAGAKYVVAMRESRRDPLLTKLYAWIYYRLIRTFVVADYPARGFDVALMDRSILPFLQRAGKNVNVRLFAFWLGFRPATISYERPARQHGKSRWTLAKKIKLFLDSLLGFSALPIRIISLIGLLVALVSFGFGVTVVVSALMGDATVRGFPALATLISFLLGLIIMMLGVIGEYLWRIADETNQRPEAVIDEIF